MPEDPAAAIPNWNLDDAVYYERVIAFTLPWAKTYGDMSKGKTDRDKREAIRSEANKKWAAMPGKFKWWAVRIRVRKTGARPFDIENVPKLIIDAFCRQRIRVDQSEYPHLALYEDDTVDEVRLLQAYGERTGQGEETMVEVFGRRLSDAPPPRESRMEGITTAETPQSSNENTVRIIPYKGGRTSADADSPIRTPEYAYRNALNSFVHHFTAYVQGGNLPASEATVTHCLAMGLQDAWNLPSGGIVFEEKRGSSRFDLWLPASKLLVEVKYPLKGESNSSRRGAGTLGSILYDFNKLAHANADNRIFVLVARSTELENFKRSNRGYLPFDVCSSPRPLQRKGLLALDASVGRKAEGGDRAPFEWKDQECELLWTATLPQNQAPKEHQWHFVAWYTKPSPRPQATTNT